MKNRAILGRSDGAYAALISRTFIGRFIIMDIIDDIFNKKEFISPMIEDDRYRDSVDRADKYLQLLSERLSDHDILEKFKLAVEECGELERKQAFIDGVRFGLKLKELL